MYLLRPTLNTLYSYIFLKQFIQCHQGVMCNVKQFVCNLIYSD